MIYTYVATKVLLEIICPLVKIVKKIKHTDKNKQIIKLSDK